MHLITPLGLFRRVEDGWSPRREIILDKEARQARERQQSNSPIKLPTHEILSHAIVYPVTPTNLSAVDSEDPPRIVTLPVGSCVAYEWLGTSDGYPHLATYLTAVETAKDGVKLRTEEILIDDACVVLNCRLDSYVRIVVDFSGPMFQDLN